MSEDQLQQVPLTLLKPKYVKMFQDEVLEMEFINRNYILFGMRTKIVIYRGWSTGELHQSIDIPTIYHYMMQESAIPLYSYSLCPLGDEISKFAALPPVPEEPDLK